MALEVQSRRRQPRGGWRSTVQFHPVGSLAVEIGAHDQRHRTPQRRVQATDQNPDRLAEPRYRGDAALGFVGVRTNPNAQGQWMGDLGSANPTSHP